METFSLKEIEAITMLAAGYLDKDIATKCGVTTKTISRWKAREDFQKILRECSAKMLDAALSELCLGAIESAKELRRIINDPDVASRTKIAAIQCLLSMASKVKDEALERRLEAVEGILDDIDSSKA